MAVANPPDPVREYQLIEKLELRIASAKDDAQFEDIISKFLPALILKLASETSRNRDLAIKVCQYVSQRLKISQSIQVPLPGLFKNLQGSDSVFVRRFSLVFIQIGLGRVRPASAPALLPEILKFAVPDSTESDATSQKLWSIAFDFLLDGLQTWKAPERRSKDDIALSETFGLTKSQCSLLSAQLSRFLLFDPKLASTAEGITEDFQPVFLKHYRQRTTVVPPVADFLFSAVFDDDQRLIPATIMSVDANATASGKADVMFKQCNFDFESDTSVEALFDLYHHARPKLQTRILALLSRSQKSTEKSERIFNIIERQLASSETGLETAKLRAAMFSYLTWAVRMGTTIGDIAKKTQELLRDFIERQGWPTPQDRSPMEVDLRSKAYESIGLLASVNSGDDAERTSIGLITWLFTSLRCDESRDIRSSIEEALSRIMNTVPTEDTTFASELRDLLLWNIRANRGDADPVYGYETIHSTRYTAVRFSNKCLTFDDATARLIDVLAAGNVERKELSDEGERGLDPFWHRSNQSLTGDPQMRSLSYPSFTDLFNRFFKSTDTTELISNGPSLNLSILFCRNILLTEALRGTINDVDESPEWRSTIDALISNNVDARAAVRKHLDGLSAGLLSDFLTLALQEAGPKSDRVGEVVTQLLGLCDNTALEALPTTVYKVLRNSLGHTDSQYRAARSLGILQSLSGDPSRTVLTDLEQCAGWKDAIGTHAVRVRGHLLSSTFIATRAMLRSPTSSNEAQVPLAELLNAIVLEATDLSMKNTAIECLGQLALCSRAK
jgi:proteasome component ECM29